LFDFFWLHYHLDGVGHNQLRGVFPQSLAMLVKLKALVVSHNQFQGFDGVGIWKQLPDLRQLEINNNNITGFVGDWGDCKKLVSLDLCKYKYKYT
jgi:hypothetical protein